MSDDSQIRRWLLDLADTLDSGDEESQAVIVRKALRGPQDKFEEFLVSNTLWGGSGSIADQACIADQVRRTRVEDLLVSVGIWQIEAGRINPRTKMWIGAFQHRAESGVR
jgi:hypothetical protein